MKLETFLVADHAAATPDGKLYINGGGITEFTVPSVPVVVPALSLVLRFAVDAGDVGEHTFDLALKDPQGRDLIPSQTAPLTIQPPTGHPDSESYMQAAVVFGPVLIAMEGIFTLVLKIDGEIMRTMKLPAKAVGPPGSLIVEAPAAETPA